MEITNYCPIVIATLNRFEHFKRCVESLQNCENADKTEIFISVDYPLKKEHKNGYEKILNYLNENPLMGFKKAHIYYQEKNLGVVNNYKFLIEELPDDSDWYIFLEDDNEFSEGFLNFINTTIEKFKNDSSFYGVCGYSRLNNFDEQHWYKSVEPTYGTAQSVKLGKEASKEINEIYKRILSLKELIKIHKCHRLCVGAYADYLIYDPDVYYTPERTVRLIDYTVGLWLALKDNYVVQPTIAYVRNHGCDGSGENSGVNKAIYNNEISKRMYDRSDFICEKGFEVSRDYINDLNKNRKVVIESAKGWVKMLMIKIFGLTITRKIFHIKNR